MVDPNYLHNSASAAHRAGVTVETLHEWVADGLRAMPKGRVGKTGPKNFLIKESWLAAYMDAVAERQQAEHARSATAVGSPVSAPKAKARGRGVAGHPGVNLDDPIGPIVRRDGR